MTTRDTILPGSWVLHDVCSFDGVTASKHSVAHQVLYQHDAKSVVIDVGDGKMLVLHFDQITAVYPEDTPYLLPKAPIPPQR